jgi:hypothetical protein
MYLPLDFMIIGVQKGGTTALSHFLGQHEQICMADGKEVHLFDGPEFDPCWTVEEVNQRYAPYFQAAIDGQLLAEATPIYVYWPEVIAALQRYNPALKLIVILRDPVERAISQYTMESGRGLEQRPLWLALLLETVRLHRDTSRELNSARRCHSYRTRGNYAEQLKNLRLYFPDQQILVIENNELIEQHNQTLARVCAFLGVRDNNLPAAERVFAGDYDKNRNRLCRWLLKCWFRPANRRLKTLLNDMGYSPNWPWLR